MFGYVRINESELKLREYALYKGVYCGLCKTMKKRTCRSSTLSLSYDFTFLAFFRAALLDEGFELTPGRCGLHPLRKRPMARESEALDFCAGASAVLKYYKLLDDLQDGDKKGIIRMLLPGAKRHLKKAINEFPQFKLDELSVLVSNELKNLSSLEKEGASADACADSFGKLLANVFSHAITDENKFEIAKKTGYHIGKWIYITDAIHDFEDDKSSGSFNPFIYMGYTELPKELISSCLTMELGAAYDAVKALDIKYGDIENVILNTITQGMPMQIKRILRPNSHKALADDDTGSEA